MRAPSRGGDVAGYKPAKRQVENLRYGVRRVGPAGTSDSACAGGVPDVRLTWWDKWPRPIALEMKICLYGITGIGVGKHNLKDPRLDQADRLVEAKKKTYVQVETVDDQALVDADAILVDAASRTDLILRDLELIETRLGREPSAAEKAALIKLAAVLESEVTVREAGLSEEDRGALAVHSFVTSKPVVTAQRGRVGVAGGTSVACPPGGGVSQFLDGGRQGESGMGDPGRDDGMGGGGNDSLGYPEGVHSGGDHRISGSRGSGG